MENKILLGGLLLIFLCGCSSKVEKVKPMVNISPIELTNINQSQLLTLINKARSEAKECGTEHKEAVDPLAWNETLERIAYNHSKDMATNNFFSHTGSDGKLPSQRLDDSGYTWSRSAENIGNGYLNEKAVVRGWLVSRDHCVNIMDGHFTQMGIAKDGEFWTQVFTN